ncbi:hypothetical protein HID58_048342 [Brassica napus]|uniref:Uncharacterized protein n=1 Tax=Brassica napus TaxID=3708 RepID=A0ABQ8B1U9_BRANA|nr:hypothetical protein HID58_048342 [Brassica napus]
MLGTASPWLGQSLFVFDFVLLVVGLPSIVSARFAFIASLVALTFTMFATRDLDNIFVRVCYVGLEGYFWCAELVSWSFGPFYTELCGFSVACCLVCSCLVYCIREARECLRAREIERGENERWTAAEKDVTKNIDGLIQNIGCELSLSYPLLFIGLMVDDSGRQSREVVVAGAFKGDEADTAEEENYDFLYAS